MALILLFLSTAGLAQFSGGGSADCNVRAGQLEVTEAGELAYPEPTADQCAAVAAIVDRLLELERRDFRRVVNREAIPGNVYTSISRFGTFGGPWIAGGVPRSDLPGLKHAVSWLSDNLVVIVSEASDFAGPTTTVVIVDLEAMQSCTYTDWPDVGDPRSIGIDEIQRVLDSRRTGRPDQPICRLERVDPE